MNATMRLSLLALVVLSITSCRNGLTAAEARASLEESAAEAEVSGLTSSSAEIGTHFTIGMAVNDAASELKTFVESQLPCARVTLEAATLTIEYGVNPGACSYMGKTFSGSHSISVMRNEMSDVLVHHVWTDLSDGDAVVTGEADVTWSLAAQSRHVVYTYDWMRESDAREGAGDGDITQTALAEGVLTGIEVNGERHWTGRSGAWDLTVSHVQMRWIDPIPQAGTYTLETPFDKSADLSFMRIDANTIRATLSSGPNTFAWNVTALGITDE